VTFNATFFSRFFVAACPNRSKCHALIESYEEKTPLLIVGALINTTIFVKTGVMMMVLLVDCWDREHTIDVLVVNFNVRHFDSEVRDFFCGSFSLPRFEKCRNSPATDW
jgi:hypothetical protein